MDVDDTEDQSRVESSDGEGDGEEEEEEVAEEEEEEEEEEEGEEGEEEDGDGDEGDEDDDFDSFPEMAPNRKNTKPQVTKEVVLQIEQGRFVKGIVVYANAKDWAACVRVSFFSCLFFSNFFLSKILHLQSKIVRRRARRVEIYRSC
jgi:cobalamin biosynthesis protein CobT